MAGAAGPWHPALSERTPMTEQEWLECDNAREMLQFFWSDKRRRTKAARRKLRLFSCACVRRIWHLLDGQFREPVMLAERLADRLVDWKECKKTNRETTAAMFARQRSPEPWVGYAARAASILLTKRTCNLAFIACAEAEWACAWSEQPHSAHGVGEQQEQAAKRERKVQADLLRDVFGPLPFRPVTIEPAWLTSTVTSLAQAIYDQRAFDRMPVLGDALEDAGCTHADVLQHCRQPAEHVRGCWLVDALLGKE